MGFVMEEKIYWNKDWLYEQYWEKEMTLQQMGEIANCSLTQIIAWMDRHEIERRYTRKPNLNKLYRNKDWMYKQYIVSGQSMNGIAKMVGCQVTTISYWLMRHGIKKKKSSGRQKKNEKGYKHRCKHCGKTFFFRDGRERIYCSKKCNGLAQRNRTIIVCQQCKKGVEIRTKEIIYGHGRFCSRECWYRWETGENAVNWRGGVSPYSYEFNKEFKRMIRKRDRYKCAVCEKRALCVHHIDYDKTNTVPENCITLCRSCHSKTNCKNREYWTERLSPIAIERSIQAHGPI